MSNKERICCLWAMPHECPRRRQRAQRVWVQLEEITENKKEREYGKKEMEGEKGSIPNNPPANLVERLLVIRPAHTVKKGIFGRVKEPQKGKKREMSARNSAYSTNQRHCNWDFSWVTYVRVELRWGGPFLDRLANFPCCQRQEPRRVEPAAPAEIWIPNIKDDHTVGGWLVGARTGNLPSRPSKQYSQTREVHVL